MATTIKDIARKTNLSITTVSLVLNNKAPKIPEKTKQLVIETAREMDYYPNQIAISLLKKQTKTLGLLIPDIRNSFFSNLAKAVEDGANKKGWTVILCNTNDHHERDLEYIRLLSQKGVDGILFCMASDTTQDMFIEVDALLRSLKIPFVMVDRSFDIPGLNVAKINHKLGGYLATEHLLKLGHRKIACITGPTHLTDSRDRLCGYQDALSKYGIPYREDMVFNGHYQMSGGFNAVKHLKKEDYTAIFAFNDLMAFGAYKALKILDIKVPDQVSLVGYDDISFSQMFEVPLTTIRQPISKVGKSAVEFLIESIEENVPDQLQLMVSPSLVVRESTRQASVPTP